MMLAAEFHEHRVEWTVMANGFGWCICCAVACSAAYVKLKLKGGLVFSTV